MAGLAFSTDSVGEATPVYGSGFSTNAAAWSATREGDASAETAAVAKGDGGEAAFTGVDVFFVAAARAAARVMVGRATSGAGTGIGVMTGAGAGAGVGAGAGAST